MRTETITVVAPCDWINANQRLHWTKRNYLTQTWKTAAMVKAKSARVQPFTELVDISVTIHKQWGGRWDPHNLMPTSKALIDGLVKAGVLVDDDRRHLRRVSIEAGEVKARNAVTIRVESVDAPTSPDCAAGKCRACDGAAWDHDADEPADCGCGCHGGAS